MQYWCGGLLGGKDLGNIRREPYRASYDAIQVRYGVDRVAVWQILPSWWVWDSGSITCRTVVWHVFGGVDSRFRLSLITEKFVLVYFCLVPYDIKRRKIDFSKDGLRMGFFSRGGGVWAMDSSHPCRRWRGRYDYALCNSGRSRLTGGYDLDRSTDLPNLHFKEPVCQCVCAGLMYETSYTGYSYALQAYGVAVLGQIPGEATPTQHNHEC